MLCAWARGVLTYSDTDQVRLVMQTIEHVGKGCAGLFPKVLPINCEGARGGILLQEVMGDHTRLPNLLSGIQRA